MQFTAANHYAPQSIDISSAVAQSKIRRVAGGRLFDFNYGYKADLIQDPFTITLVLVGDTVADIDQAYESLAHPTFGVIGERDVLKGTDRRGFDWQITALLESVTKVLTENDSIDKNTIMDGVELSFVPATNYWTEVT